MRSNLWGLERFKWAHDQLISWHYVQPLSLEEAGETDAVSLSVTLQQIKELPGVDLAGAIETLSGQVQHAVFSALDSEKASMLGAAPSWGDEPTQREITLLSNEKNGQDRCWPAAPHLNCFSVAEAPAR